MGVRVIIGERFNTIAVDIRGLAGLWYGIEWGSVDDPERDSDTRVRQHTAGGNNSTF